MGKQATPAATRSTKRSSSKKKEAAAPVIAAMSGVGTADAAITSELEGLLADLHINAAPEAGAEDPSVVIEPTIGEVSLEAATVDEVVIEPTIEATEADLEAAIGAVGVTEHYASLEGDAPIAAGDAPTDATIEAADADPAPAEGDAAPETAEVKTPKEKKERLHFANKVDRIKHRLGDKLGDYMILETADAMLDGDDLVAKQNATLDILNAMNVKEKNRASLLLDFASGKSSKLNEVMARALACLNADGKLQTGDKGNLHINLLAKPYSANAARAMGRNTINIFAKLKLVNLSTKGEYVPNADSLLLAKINSLMAAPTPAAA